METGYPAGFPNQHVHRAFDFSVRREVDSAFLVCGLFPPPAARPFVFTRLSGTRAGTATINWYILRVKWVPGTSLARMYSSTCSFVQSASGLSFTRPPTSSTFASAFSCFDCVRRKPTAQARNSLRLRLQRTNLANVAAKCPAWHRLVEQIRTMALSP